MILVRLVFQAKFGKAGELARGMVESVRAESGSSDAGRARVLTDLSGQFDTVVLEFKAESLATWEEQRKETFASAQFQQTFQRTNDLIESGRTEFYTIES
jgi:hypothetical protein